MKRKIVEQLHQFEKVYGVKIILAVESGSRGWGFASEDSDYDIRFVYKYPLSKYTELRQPKDSHSWIENEYDYEGYDIHKFYDLLWKSNMNIIDWLFQSEIYIDELDTYGGDLFYNKVLSKILKSKNLKDELKEIVLNNFNRNTYIAHNYGLCKKNYHKYFEIPLENEPTAKRYVYCIRALLSAQYCYDNNTVAPLNFYELIEKTVKDKRDKKEISDMVEIKKKTKEKQWYRNAKWQNWIQQRLNSEHEKLALDTNHEDYYQKLNNHMLKMMQW